MKKDSAPTTGKLPSQGIGGGSPPSSSVIISCSDECLSVFLEEVVCLRKNKTKQTANKKVYDKEYHKSKMLSIAFRLSRENDADLIEIYESLPNKMEWFREALRSAKKS